LGCSFILMVRCFITVAFIAQALGASAQAAVRPEPQVDAKPKQTYDSLVKAYLKGDADAAVAELATWTAKRIENDSIPITELPRESKETLRVVALMHTEAMLKQGVRALSDAHLRIARDAMGELRWRTGMDAFCDSWQVIASSFLLSAGLPTEALSFPDLSHPELLLLGGSIRECSSGF
jgi:hypothetical protein